MRTSIHKWEVEKIKEIVSDRQHADYLAEIDSEFANEGIYLNYRDEK
jgi:hypothetical protein